MVITVQLPITHSLIRTATRPFQYRIIFTISHCRIGETLGAGRTVLNPALGEPRRKLHQDGVASGWSPVAVEEQVLGTRAVRPDSAGGPRSTGARERERPGRPEAHAVCDEEPVPGDQVPPRIRHTFRPTAGATGVPCRAAAGVHGADRSPRRPCPGRLPTPPRTHCFLHGATAPRPLRSASGTLKGVCPLWPIWQRTRRQ